MEASPLPLSWQEILVNLWPKALVPPPITPQLGGVVSIVRSIGSAEGVGLADECPHDLPGIIEA
jgi:hypothetical protein